MYIGDHYMEDFNLQEAPWLPWSCKTEESLKTVSEFDPRFNIAHQLPFCTSSSCAEQKESRFLHYFPCTAVALWPLHWICTQCASLVDWRAHKIEISVDQSCVHDGGDGGGGGDGGEDENHHVQLYMFCDDGDDETYLRVHHWCSTGEHTKL